MIKWGVFSIVLLALAAFGTPTQVSALGLKVAPLEYKTTLKDGERKQGFVDVSNPSSQAVNVAVSVQAFKQINNEGGLQFYDDKQANDGIKPELTTVELGPREAVRLAFTIDGSLLPEGDVFAAIFFTTDPKQPRNGVGQLVRVGTLLSLVNKNPGPREAEITGINLPALQLTDTVIGTYSIKNTGKESTGFYPTVGVSSWPGGKAEQKQSSLLFGGRERTNDLRYRTGVGIHRVEVSFGNSKKSQWVVMVAPWMLVLAMLIILVVAIELLLLKKRRKSAKKSKHSKTPPTS